MLWKKTIKQGNGQQEKFEMSLRKTHRGTPIKIAHKHVTKLGSLRS